MKPGEGSSVIGQTVTLRGEMSGSGDLFLDGTFEGTIQLMESRLTIGPNARVSADVRVKDLVVFGTLLGNVEATGRIELRQTAVMQGDLVASRLSVEESASMRGKVELTGKSTSSA